MLDFKNKHPALRLLDATASGCLRSLLPQFASEFRCHDKRIALEVIFFYIDLVG